MQGRFNQRCGVWYGENQFRVHRCFNQLCSAQCFVNSVAFGSESTFSKFCFVFRFSLLNLFGREAFRVAGIAAIGFISHAVSADPALRVHLFQPCVAPCSCTRRCWARSHVVKRFMWCGLLANEVVAAPPNKICYQAARLSVVSWQVAQHCFAMWWQMQLKELQRTP